MRSAVLSCVALVAAAPAAWAENVSGSAGAGAAGPLAVATLARDAEPVARHIHRIAAGRVRRIAVDPATRLEGVLAGAAALPADAVLLVIDSEQGLIAAVRQRGPVLYRDFPRGTISGSPYLVAVAAVELAAITRAGPTPPAAAADTPIAPAWRRRSFTPGVSATMAWAAVTSDQLMPQPSLGVEVAVDRGHRTWWPLVGLWLAPRGRLTERGSWEGVLPPDASAGTADALAVTDLQVMHERKEAGLRVALGRNMGPRHALVFGPSLAMVWTRAGFDYAQELGDESLWGFYPSPWRRELQAGLGGEGRWLLGQRVSLAVTVESLFVPRAAEHRCEDCALDLSDTVADTVVAGETAGLSTSVRSPRVFWRVGVGLAWQHGAL